VAGPYFNSGEVEGFNFPKAPKEREFYHPLKSAFGDSDLESNEPEYLKLLKDGKKEKSSMNIDSISESSS